MLLVQHRIGRQHRELVELHVGGDVEVIAERKVEAGHAQAFEDAGVVTLVLEEVDIGIGVGRRRDAPRE